MKKNIIIIILVLMLIAPLPIFSATNDFVANGNITVTGVTFGAGTADMLILDTSTAESWTFNSGTFTVTNPGTFKVGSSDSNVKSIKTTRGSVNTCTENAVPGTTYVTLSTTAGTYTIIPLDTTDCTTLCATVSNAATYNSYPTCGAATCNSGYSLSGSGSSATCVASGGGIILITTYCSSVEYDEWQESCVNGLQYRNVLSHSPNNCTLTSSQEDNRKRQCGIMQAEDTTAGVPATDSKGDITLAQITADAEVIALGDINQVVAEMGVRRNLAAEINYNETIVEKIVVGSGITAEVRNIITNFVSYGTKSTKILGAGERAGVVNSFQAAFGKLPTTVEDWNDVMKIANGRWPNQRNKQTETNATQAFRKVYLREPDKTDPYDDAAVTIIAYGLRPADRNLDSEKTAIKFFKAIYGYNPFTATAWDIIRAIAYSGATR